MINRQTILLEALITERDGMNAENNQRISLGQSVAYRDEEFCALAKVMRGLLDE